MQERLAPLLAKGAFKSIDLHGPDGRLVWSTVEPLEETAPELTRALQQARQSRRVARVGPYLHASGNGHLDFVVPLGEDAGATPLVVLRTDIEDGLCPILSTWPSPSQSGESLLIRRDGEQVRHLCPSRHLPDAAMRLSLPVAETSLLSARLLRGELAPGEAGVARDYRGVPVLGVAQPIADSDWLVITKIDRAEIRASAMPQIALVALTGTGALLAVIGLMAALRNRERLALATATQEAQTERLRALGLLAALADSSDDAIFAKDLDGRYTLINQSASRLFGITPDAALGHTDHELLTPELADAFIAHDRQAIANDAPIRFEEQVNPSADRPTLLTTKGPLRDPSGRVIGVFGIARDITERKAADAARRESEGVCGSSSSMPRLPWRCSIARCAIWP
jgi:PAS domain S-box-containing protein